MKRFDVYGIAIIALVIIVIDMGVAMGLLIAVRVAQAMIA